MKFFDEINKLINQGDTLIVVVSKEPLAQSLSGATKQCHSCHRLGRKPLL